ncbi:TetR/AcrR family transcriptional regulator [Methanococcus voltae]|uniref:AcrR family transcriptional regulator n=2 Tax=Methanococcus voltae TaxID=2188 RepID=A0A8J7S5N7_METVO|nr:TetR/AcrR family transcriptional regulator [Methanococcus voltae]MBP2172954.1 AcrR family transcriptional regulator [Methanococcus voltae]MBP2201990.1 AcrR family transcriptional regulator [Methanococcus voltae]MCS3922153.1 AcrR family transcriptional regulator [Methanococcus voltae PS]
MNNLKLEKNQNADTREIILQNATELFLNNGYDRTSLNEIAKSSGITKGGIYHYYSSKEKLHDAVIEYIFSKLFNPLLEDIKKEKSFKRIIEIALNLDEEYEEPKTLWDKYKYLKLFIDYLEKTPKSLKEIDTKYNELHRIIEKKFIEAQNSGQIKSEINPVKFTVKLFSIVTGLRHESNRPDIEKYISELKKEFAKELWDSIKIK